jgi:hypothetical protein
MAIVDSKNIGEGILAEEREVVQWDFLVTGVSCFRGCLPLAS